MTIDQILRAVEQLSPDEQARLIILLQTHAHEHPISVADKMALLREAQLDEPVANEPSLSRADWYSDKKPDTRSLEEVFDSIERHRWTPPPGAPSPSQMIRDDRDNG